jgi:thiosulfate reductase/polysulfide reductase chain A
VKTIGNTKPSDQIWIELATQLGLGDAYPWKNMQEYHKMQTAGNEAFYSDLTKAGWISYGMPVMTREPSLIEPFVRRYPASAAKIGSDGTFAHLLKFNTPSGKIELFSQQVEDLKPGYGLPKFRNLPMRADGELFFIQGKTALHTNGATIFVPKLARLMKDNPVWIHPETAAKYGIEDGDMVELENSVGKEKAHAMITPAVRPDTVFTYMAGFGTKAGYQTTKASKRGIMCANLLPMATTDITGMTVHCAGVRLSKAKQRREEDK